MGILNTLSNIARAAMNGTNPLGNNPLSQSTVNPASTAVNAGIGAVVGGLSNQSRQIAISAFPRSVAELMQMPEARLSDEFEVAALCIAVLCNYEADRNSTIEMLNVLRGPRPMSPQEAQFIDDRILGKMYKVLSFYNGATPSNNYQASLPYTLDISTNTYSYQNADYATLWLKSGGADNKRPITLRRKPSTGQWFVWEFSNLLGDIRIAVQDDPWA